MSLSNPHKDGQPNPSVRWFEWNGERGAISYYDKEAKASVDVPIPFGFILLDELGSVRGWHDASSSGIYSNEVKDTRQDTLVVKAFKGGTLVEGLYKDIKDRVNSVGGSFHANCYIAFKEVDGLKIGVIRFRGASLGAWMEFRKDNRKEFYTKSIKVTGFTEGKKGRIVFRIPTFSMVEIALETMSKAIKLDEQLQEFLKGYLSRNKQDQVDVPAPARPDAPEQGDDGPEDQSDPGPDETHYNQHGVDVTDADLPF